MPQAYPGFPGAQPYMGGMGMPGQSGPAGMPPMMPQGMPPGMPQGQNFYQQPYTAKSRRSRMGGTYGNSNMGAFQSQQMPGMAAYPYQQSMPVGGYPGQQGMPGMYQSQQMPMMGQPAQPMQTQQMPGFSQPMQMGQQRRRPGLISRMSGAQQGSGNQSYQGQMLPQVQQQGGMGQPRGLRLGKRNMPQMPQAPQQVMQQPQVSPMGRPIKPKQFTLKDSNGGNGGSGIASINDSNSMSLIANNLPDPAGMAQTNPNLGANPVYVAYLTNRKGQGSFPVGQLYPIGGGTYRLAFQSNVPFYDYDHVIVSLENPSNIQSAPVGPVVLSSGTGAGLSIPKPVRNFFNGVWGKVKGVTKKKKKEQPEPLPELTGMPQNSLPSLLENYNLGPMPVHQAPVPAELPGLGAALEEPQLGGNP